MEEKRTKLIFTLSKSAKITWGLKHEALKAIYTGGMLPLLLYGAPPAWKSVRNMFCYKTKLIRIRKLINIRIAKACRTVSNEACVITVLIRINIKIEEIGKYYELTKGKGTQYEKEMEVKYWNHPAKHVKIIEVQEHGTHCIQMAILKALEFIQNSKAGKKTVLIYTDIQITLQLLQNQKKHTNLVEQIRTNVIEMEKQD